MYTNLPNDKDGLYYLGSPYSHPDKIIQYLRYKVVTNAAAKLVNAGFILFCPITQSHNIAMAGNINTSWEFWKKFDETILDRCDGLIVLMIDGWSKSVGLTAEIDYAIVNHIPIYYIEPGDL